MTPGDLIGYGLAAVVWMFALILAAFLLQMVFGKEPENVDKVSFYDTL
jgi:hypothetical protein